MKILHVIPSFAPAWCYGGPVYAALGLTRELARQGHEVSVMTTNMNGSGVLDMPMGRPVAVEGVKVWYFPVERPRRWFFSRSLGNALKGYVKRFDLVHIHSIFLWPTTVAAFWCRRHRVPYIIRPSGSLDPICLTKSYGGWRVSLSSRARKGAYIHTLGRFDLQRASAIHFTSQAEMEAARALQLRPPGFVVPLGVEFLPGEERSPTLRLRERYPQLAGKKIVLFLSRLDPVKGLDLLISGLSGLIPRRRDLALVVAGSGDRAYEAEMVGLAERLGLGGCVVFVGPVQGQEKWRLLREGDLFALPSHHENFGIAVVEAMAMGLPVVISHRVNIHEEISRAKAGLVTDLDPRGIATAIERLLNDEGLRKEMGRRGARLVRERFTWEKVAKEMVARYEDVVSSAQKRP